MLRKGALVVLVAALAGAAMLATVPAATATTEPAVTFFVHVRGHRLAGRDLVPGLPGPPPVPSRLGGALRRRQPRHQAVHGRHRRPSHAGASAGTEAAPQRLLRRSRAVPVQGRGQRRAQAQRLASRHLAHGLPLLVFLGAVTVATAGSSGVAVTRPARRRAEPWWRSGRCRTGAGRARGRRPARRSPPALSRCSSPRGDSASAARAAVSAS